MIPIRFRNNATYQINETLLDFRKFRQILKSQ